MYSRGETKYNRLSASFLTGLAVGRLSSSAALNMVSNESHLGIRRAIDGTYFAVFFTQEICNIIVLCHQAALVGAVDSPHIGNGEGMEDKICGDLFIMSSLTSGSFECSLAGMAKNSLLKEIA